jgi:hypothetical protein
MGAETLIAWRERTRKKLMAAFGGKCNKCGYDFCSEAMDFHHLDPSKKDFAISKALECPKKWDIIVDEVKKCILLCCRCHRELHCKLWSLDQIKIVTVTDLEHRVLKKDTVTGQCPVCNKDVYGRICCSLTCAGRKARKVEWPSNQELKLLLKTNSKSQIARDLGVSETAVRKRIAKYEAEEANLVKAQV